MVDIPFNISLEPWAPVDMNEAGLLVGKNSSFFRNMRSDNRELYDYLMNEAGNFNKLIKEFKDYQAECGARLYLFAELYLMLEEHHRETARSKKSWLKSQADSSVNFRAIKRKAFVSSDYLKVELFKELPQILKTMAKKAHSEGLLEKYNVLPVYRQYIQGTQD